MVKYPFLEERTATLPLLIQGLYVQIKLELGNVSCYGKRKEKKNWRKPLGAKGEIAREYSHLSEFHRLPRSEHGEVAVFAG